MIIVTGGAGFIGSNIIADLEAEGRGPIIVVDWMETGDKWRNLAGRKIGGFVEPFDLLGFLERNGAHVKLVVHMGAISATTERDVDRLVRLNINYSVMLWDWCAKHLVPLIYASSAATYGGREGGFLDDDRPEELARLAPLNAYGWSKKATDDIFAMRVAAKAPAPPQWVGLKFFNVFGPNEYHKGDMMSVVAKMFDTVKAGEKVRLFKSYRPSVADGEQRRDFVYVKDCSLFVSWLVDNPHVSGIFNVGTGRARSFLDIVNALGLALGKKVDIEFSEMPELLKDRYQYYTEADMSKASRIGFSTKFSSLEESVSDYVHRHLNCENRYR